MIDYLENANGLQIIVDETEPKARIYMFIDGKYTHWVDYDIDQMYNLLDVVTSKIDEMVENMQ
jgi:adenosine/AMP kinase